MSYKQYIPSIASTRAFVGDYFTAGRRFAATQYASFRPYIPAFPDVRVHCSRVAKYLAPHKYKILSVGGAIGTAVAVAGYVLTRPEYPTFMAECSQEYGKFSISAPSRKKEPLSVCFTFVVDQSRSMDTGSRLEKVICGLRKTLSDAQKTVSAEKNTKIKFAVVGFSVEATTILESVDIKARDNKALSAAKEAIENMATISGTRFDAGMERGVSVLEKMAKSDKQAKHVLVLLTDGEKQNDNFGSGEISSIHKRMAKINAQFYAIGIGSGHGKEYLKEIAGVKEKSLYQRCIAWWRGEFAGTYIDTTQKGVTIQKTISSIYGRSLARFTDISLRLLNVRNGMWTMYSSKKGTALSEGKKITNYIRVHREKFQDSFDLNQIWVQLNFTDPKGRKGTIWERWNANSIVRPDLIRQFERMTSEF